jgi:hypothetical protein
MGTPRTLPEVVANSTYIVPVYSGTPIHSASASIKNGIATIVLGSALPANGFNGPNNPIQGNWPAPNGQQVTLWAFGATFGSLFNGKTVSVISNDPVARSFSFYYNHADISSTADTSGYAAAIPVQQYRAVRIELDSSVSTDTVYVGDFALSTSQYMAALTLAGQMSIEVAGENIRADRIFVLGSGSSDPVHVSLIY